MMNLTNEQKKEIIRHNNKLRDSNLKEEKLHKKCFCGKHNLERLSKLVSGS